MLHNTYMRIGNLPNLIATFSGVLVAVATLACSQTDPTPGVTLTPIVPPTPTAGLVPTLTPAPVAAATQTRAELTLSDSTIAELTTRAYEIASDLVNDFSPRQSATELERIGADYLVQTMMILGYEVAIQDFKVTEAWPAGTIEVLNDDSNGLAVLFESEEGESPRTFAVPFSRASSGIAEGETAWVGRGSEEDYYGVDVDGKVVLIQRGTTSFEDKIRLARSRGAIAAVIFNNEPNFYFVGELQTESDIPVVAIQRTDGVMIRDAIEAGERIVLEVISYPPGNGDSRNVVAELNNDVEDDNVIVLGAHLDTTPWSAGANDNGSGLATLITVAQELVDDDLPFDLRFIFFGSEETGLHGSTYYVLNLPDSQLDRIDAMINVDVVGTGELEAFGADELTDALDDAAEDAGIEIEITEPWETYSSDHAPFEASEVEYLMLFADDVRYINHPSDTLEHVRPELLGQSAYLVLELIEALAEEATQN